VTGAFRMTLVALQPEFTATMAVTGQVIVGGVWSVTMTCC